MRRRSCAAPPPPSASGPIGRWCTESPCWNALHDRARRIAAATDLCGLEDQRRAIELAWIHAQISDEEHVRLLEFFYRRHAHLVARELRQV